MSELKRYKVRCTNDVVIAENTGHLLKSLMLFPEKRVSSFIEAAPGRQPEQYYRGGDGKHETDLLRSSHVPDPLAQTAIFGIFLTCSRDECCT